MRSEFNTVIAALVCLTAPALGHAMSLQHLFEVSSPVFEERYNVAVMSDRSGDFEGIMYSLKDGTPQNAISEDALNKGVTIYHDKAHNLDVVRMYTVEKGFNSKDGGLVKITYIYDAAFHRSFVRVFTIQLVRDGKTWSAYKVNDYHWDARLGAHQIDREAQPFTQMEFVPAYIFGKVVGVSYVKTW